MSFSSGIDHQLYTMCMIQNGDQCLLINRPDKKGFPGYIAPGGKVDFPESLVDGAIREVKEETGLTVRNLTFKGLDEYVNPSEHLRYMVFNYLATEFEGELLNNPPEGEAIWISLDELEHLPMQPWFRRRLPYFFKPGTFEIQSCCDGSTDKERKVTVKST
ncbi:8-oxo-dGTP diphosphatase [Fictibacillus sp. KU28468]|uniref:8-oxo-dGTP diphosphatase n=1 Tax=Fictibacillus sp. KU28468 TaxID=2991053 RepID=UPI00223DE899|nr:8-oxo-dGTP diphosphatase [Fictibacillus sp. KU28468]UZJ78239.1 8-oxo-dGTP diphosphatase [Fictibacillus sp. KU28468]